MTAALATPFEVTGAAHLPAAEAGRGRCCALEGFAGSVAHRARALARALGRLRRGAGRGGAGRLGRPSATPPRFAGREGAVWRISVKPTDGPVLGARLVPAEVIYDWAGGLLWVLAPEDLDVRAAMAGMPGHATLVRGQRGGQGALGRVPARAGAGRGALGRAPGEVRPAGRSEPGPDGPRAGPA